MNLHPLRLSLCLLFIFLVACQPVQPESELERAAPDSAGATISESATITDPVASTPSDGGASASTPSTPASGLDESITTCPAIDPSGENAPLDIAILANWEAGEQHTYLVNQERVESEDDNAAVTLASSTPATVTVLSAAEDGYTLEWTYGRSELGELDVELPSPLANLLEAPMQVHFRYSTNEDGAYLELLNLEELREQIIPLFDQVFAAFEETDEELTPEAIEAARAMVDGLLADPANFEPLFAGEVQLIHTLYGFEFEDAEPIVTADLRPNILGGSPIPSELTITPTHYDAEQGCLIVTFENIADPIAARNSILEALQEQARLMGVPEPTDDDLPPEMVMEDVIRFEFDLHSAWPTRISMERTTAISNQGRVETAEILLMP